MLRRGSQRCNPQLHFIPIATEPKIGAGEGGEVIAAMGTTSEDGKTSGTGAGKAGATSMVGVDGETVATGETTTRETMTKVSGRARLYLAIPSQGPGKHLVRPPFPLPIRVDDRV